MTYSEKLKDPRWQRKRLEIFQRDGFKCSYCNDKEYTLHVHHEEYHGEPWEAPNEVLKTACVHCHEILERAKNAGRTVLKICKWCNPGERYRIICVLCTDDYFHAYYANDEKLNFFFSHYHSELLEFLSSVPVHKCSKSEVADSKSEVTDFDPF